MLKKKLQTVDKTATKVGKQQSRPKKKGPLPKSPLTQAERSARRKVAPVASRRPPSDSGEDDGEEKDNTTGGDYNHLLKKDWGVDVINDPDNQGATDY